MDTSETYIKMRIAAIPDLGWGIPYQIPIAFVTENVWVDVKGDWYCKYDNYIGCQLERQDQLQEMVEHGLESGFIDWHGWLEHNYGKNYFHPFESSRRFNSWEQLWLAFVMKEKYNKVWDGENWVKAKN